MEGPRSYKPQTGVRFSLLRQPFFACVCLWMKQLGCLPSEASSILVASAVSWRSSRVERLLYKRRVGSSSLSARMMSPSRVELGLAS